MQIGSTEWVEQNYDILFSSAVAYLNVDVAVRGPGFALQSTPQLDDFIQDIAKEVSWICYSFGSILLPVKNWLLYFELIIILWLAKVEDPDNPGNTIYESWASSSPDSHPPVSVHVLFHDLMLQLMIRI